MAPVWCFEPRVATPCVCECERAVDRTTTIEVIVSEILGFFSKLSEQRQAEGSAGLKGRLTWAHFMLEAIITIASPGLGTEKLLTALRCNLYAQIADEQSKDEGEEQHQQTEATTTTLDTNEVVEKVLELLMNLSQLD